MERSPVGLPVKTGWNLFAHELALILQKRGLDLGHLDDRGDPLKRIDSVIIMRLKKSLEHEKTFPVLSPIDLEHIVSTFSLTPQEYRHLLAVILATGIQSKLTPRINALSAREAALAILPIIENALEEAELGQGPFGGLPFKIRGDKKAPERARNDFDLATEAIEQGTFTLYEYTLGAEGTKEDLQVAHNFYSLAIRHLERIPRHQRNQTPDWSYWHQEASDGLKRVEKLQGKQR